MSAQDIAVNSFTVSSRKSYFIVKVSFKSPLHPTHRFPLFPTAFGEPPPKIQCPIYSTFSLLRIWVYFRLSYLKYRNSKDLSCQCKRKSSGSWGSVFLPGVCWASILWWSSTVRQVVLTMLYNAGSCRQSGLLEVSVTCGNWDLCQILPFQAGAIASSKAKQAVCCSTLKSNQRFLKVNRNQCVTLCSARNNQLK